MRLFGFQITRTKAAVSAVSVRDIFGRIRESFAGAWQKGVTIDPIGAVASFGAVFACISRIANDIAKLEPKLLMEVDEICVAAPASSPFWRVLKTPNTFQNRIQFIAYWITCKLLYGNAYALKARQDLRGMVTGLYLLDPRRVTPMVTPEGDVYYSIGGDDLARMPSGGVVPASEIIHDRGVTLWHPLVGVSPLYACALSATQGLRIQRNSAQFFENMSRPSGMLTAPGTINDVTALRLKGEWEANYSAENIGRLAVMGDGLTYEPMTIPAEAAQLIEQLDWTVADVARCFEVPLYKINSGPMPTAGNVEALEVQYYTGCLQTYIESMELCLSEGLEVPDGYEVELNLEGLLRMDSSAQIEMLTKAAGGAIMVPNEARAKRRLGKVTGGDQLYRQQQDHSLAALAKRDAGPDPFGTAKPPAAPAPAPAPADPAAAADAKEAADGIASARADILAATDTLALKQAADTDALRKMIEQIVAGVPGLVAEALAKAAPGDEAEALTGVVLVGMADLVLAL